MTVNITLNPGGLDETVVTYTATAATIATKLANLAASINADDQASAVVKATATATVLTLTGKKTGVAFGLAVDTVGIVLPDTFVAAIVQAAVGPGAKTWRYTMPPSFVNVNATDRLSRIEAQSLASEERVPVLPTSSSSSRPTRASRRSRCPGSRGRSRGVSSSSSRTRRSSRSSWSPRIGQGAAVDRASSRRRGTGLAPEHHWQLARGREHRRGLGPSFTTGAPRDRQATVHGSVFRNLSGSDVLWLPNGELNTEVSDRVFVGFDIDAYEQVVKFGDYVYKLPNLEGAGGFAEFPGLTLETACMLTDADTDQVVRGETTRVLAARPIQWFRHEDVAVGVIADYLGTKVNEFANVMIGISLWRWGHSRRGWASKPLPGRSPAGVSALLGQDTARDRDLPAPTRRPRAAAHRLVRPRRHDHAGRREHGVLDQCAALPGAAASGESAAQCRRGARQSARKPVQPDQGTRRLRQAGRVIRSRPQGVGLVE